MATGSSIMSFATILLFWFFPYCYVLHTLSNMNVSEPRWKDNLGKNLLANTEMGIMRGYIITCFINHHVGERYVHQERFLKRIINYTTRSTISFNPAIVMLKRSEVNLVNPGRKQQCQKSTGLGVI